LVPVVVGSAQAVKIVKIGDDGDASTPTNDRA
jgi:predicted RNA-binding protein with TRAM domain